MTDALTQSARNLIMAGYVLLPVRGKIPMTQFKADDAGIRDAAGVDFWLDQGADGFAVLSRHSGVAMVDLDVKPDTGVNGVTWWAAQGLPVSPMVGITASGGAHLYFRRRTDGRSLPQRASGIAPGVDTRGDDTNGYAVAVGYGRTLTAIVPVAELPEVPDAVLALLPVTAGNQSTTGVRPSPEVSRFAEWIGQRAPQRLSAARAAIARELAAASAPSGPDRGYRYVLMRAAFTLGGYVAAGVLDADDAYADLALAASTAWGRPADDNDLTWINDGLRDGRAQPFTVYDDAALPVPPAGVPVLAVYDPTDAGNPQEHAEALLAHQWPTLRYAPDARTFIEWKRPEVWTELPAGADTSRGLVAHAVRHMPPGVAPRPKDRDEWDAEHWRSWRRDCYTGKLAGGNAGLSPAALASMTRAVISRAGHPLHADLSELDTEPEVLWAGGRAWDLRTGAADALHPSTPHLRTARCAPDATTPTPLWDQLLKAVWPDTDVREWALTVLGIALTGYADAAMPVLYGEHGRGKSSVVDLVMHCLGNYAVAADPRILAGADNTHASVIHALKGRRMAVVDEGPRRGHLATERLKQLTGGIPLTGNAMYQSPITFSPTHTLVMTTNDEPQLTDPALRRRVRMIPCDGDPADVRRARGAIGSVDGPVWASEVAGVLAQLMRRAGLWLHDQDTGTNEHAPAVVRNTTAEIADTQDTVAAWRAACTTPDAEGLPGRVLYAEYRAWCERNPAYRHTAVSETRFGRELTAAGFPSEKRGGYWMRQLRLAGPGGYSAYNNPTPAGFLAAPGAYAPTPAAPAANNPPPPEDLSAADSTPAAGGASGGESEATPPASPANPENPSSTPLSSSSLGRLAGLYSSIEENRGEGKEKGVVERNRGTTCLPPEPPLGSVTPPPARKSRSVKRQPGEPTPAQTRRAQERAAKVAELAGEAVELPALVMRTTPTPRHVEHVHVGPRLADAIEKARGHLTVDVETSGYPIGHPLYALKTIQLGTRVLVFVLDADCAVCCAIATAALKRATVLHAHNAAADIPALVKHEIATHDELWDRMEDTVLPAKLADPSSSGGDPGLKSASAAVLGAAAVSPGADEARKALFTAAGWLVDTEPTTPAEKSGWLQVDKRCATMISYAASDVLDGALLALELPTPDPAVHIRERHVQRIVAPASTYGFPLDADRVLAQHAEHTAREAELGEQVRTRLGVVNPGSPKQLGEAFLKIGAQLPVTATGKPSTAKDVMHTLAGRPGPAQELAQLVLDWRHHDTLLKLFLRPWRIAVEQGDGRVRPTVYTLGADTGRMSCVRPNMQQVPKKGGLRECVLADPGQLIISADFEGVELRVAAALSGDPVLRQALEQGLDVHRMVAAQAFGEALADENRTLAKRIVFGHIFGGGFETLAKQAGVTQDVVAACVAALQAITPRLAGWSEEIKTAIRAGNRAFATYSGRVIHLDPRQPHKGPNYLIQGTARELLADALVEWDTSSGFGGGVLMPVHDEIVAMVPEERSQLGLETLLGVMTRQLGDIAITAEAGGPPARSWHSG